MITERELKRLIRKRAADKIGHRELSWKEVEDNIRNDIEELCKEEGFSFSDEQRNRVTKEVCQDILGLGPLEELMQDDEITEIMVNGPEQIYIEKKGVKTLHEKYFDDDTHLRSILEKMLAPTGRRVDESSPFVDFSMSDGSRVNVIIPPLAVDGITVTIRKFSASIQEISDLEEKGTLSAEMSEFLMLAMKAKLNVLFSGATGSGKTTTLAVLCNGMDVGERIITIEDTLELSLPQEHVVRLVSRQSNIEGKGEISIRQLFTNTLRMRPSRIVIGEIRGEEAMDFLQAVNSGHNGTLAVLHASNSRDAVGRLETMANYAGLNLPAQAIRKQIATGIDLIIQNEQLADGKRKITEITEVTGIGDEDVEYNDIFSFAFKEVGADGSIIGDFKRGKISEALKSKIINRGFKLPDFMI